MSSFIMVFKRLFLMFRVRRRLKMLKFYCKNAVIMNISTFELGTQFIGKEFKNDLKMMVNSTQKSIKNHFKI